MLKWDDLIDENFKGRVALAFSRATSATLEELVKLPPDADPKAVLAAFTTSNFPPKTPAQVRELVSQAMPLVAGALSRQNPKIDTTDELTDDNIDAAVSLLLQAFARFTAAGGVLPNAS